MQADLDHALSRIMVQLVAGPTIDLERGAARAIPRRLAGLYLDGIAALGIARNRLAPATREGLLVASRREAADDSLVERETGEVLDALGDVRPVVLKGRALALSVWPRPALRPAGDLDLLVEHAVMDRVVSSLLERGYRRAPVEGADVGARLRPAPTGVELLPPPGRRMGVDLHVRLFRSVGHRIDPALVLQRARPALLLERPVRALDDADRLLYLLVHAAKHGARELKWVLDLYAIALRTDGDTWRRAARRAAATGTERPFYAAARLVAPLPGSAIERGILRATRPAAPWRALLGRLVSLELAIAGRPPGPIERYALEVALEPRLADRLRMAGGIVERWLRAQRRTA